MDTSMKIKTLEQKITDAEVDVFKAEVRRGMEIVFAAIGKYLPVQPGEPEESYVLRDDLMKFVNSHFEATISGEYYSAFVDKVRAVYNYDSQPVPDAIRAIIASYAAGQFVQRVAEIGSIAEEAHELANRN